MPYSPLQLANAFLQTGELADARQVLNDYLVKNNILSLLSAPDYEVDLELPELDAEQAQVDPDYEAIIRLWLDLLAHGDEADQRRATVNYHLLPHFNVDDYIKRAMLHYRLGEMTLAASILYTALVMKYPNDDRLFESLLFIYKKMGDAPAGLSLIKTKSPKWIWSRWAGDFAMIARDFATAIVYYGEALAMIKTRYALPDDAPAKILDAPTITSAEGLTIMGIYAELLLARAEAYRQNGQLEEAKADEARAKRLIPNDSTI